MLRRVCLRGCQIGNMVKVLFDDTQWYHGIVTEYDPVGSVPNGVYTFTPAPAAPACPSRGRPRPLGLA